MCIINSLQYFCLMPNCKSIPTGHADVRSSTLKGEVPIHRCTRQFGTLCKFICITDCVSHGLTISIKYVVECMLIVKEANKYN